MAFHAPLKRKPDEPSAARLAAEALFSPRPAQQAAANPCVVTVRRKRAVMTQGAPAPAGASAPSDVAGVVPAERRPRVFRVDSAVPADDGGVATAPAEVPPAVNAVNAVKAVQRRRRQAAPVVIIQSPSTPGAASATSRWTGFHLHALRYPQVAAELAQLRLLAAELRREEAERAVQWIRDMVQRYGLQPDELDGRQPPR